MTREEAIQILSTRDAHGVLCGYTSGVTEALDMAIEALSVDTVPIEKYHELQHQFVMVGASFADMFAVLTAGDR